MDPGFKSTAMNHLLFTDSNRRPAENSNAAFLTHAAKLVNHKNLRTEGRECGEKEKYGSSPLESTLFVQPHIAREQDSEENDHRDEGE